ncbi:MAG: ribonuclease III [Betaproteobacteria bacterium]|nr:ribonuclease III [Betaproteobacteria bacterium]
MDPQILARRLGHAFTDPQLMRQALTHRSHGGADNERLEFLGDGILNCVVAVLLYESFPRINEGGLSRLRARLVRQESLALIAQNLGLSDHLLLGEGELKSGGFRRPSILADTLEALVGAVFLDAGFEAARRVVGSLMGDAIADLDPKAEDRDPKTRLQEVLQSRRISLPVYRVLATRGAAHEQQFEVACEISTFQISAVALGSSRRAAEQLAAEQALQQLKRST